MKSTRTESYPHVHAYIDGAARHELSGYLYFIVETEMMHAQLLPGRFGSVEMEFRALMELYKNPTLESARKLTVLTDLVAIPDIMHGKVKARKREMKRLVQELRALRYDLLERNGLLEERWVLIKGRNNYAHRLLNQYIKSTIKQSIRERQPAQTIQAPTQRYADKLR